MFLALALLNDQGFPRFWLLTEAKSSASNQSYAFGQLFYCVIKWVLQANGFLGSLLAYFVRENNPRRFNVSRILAALLKCLSRTESSDPRCHISRQGLISP
jgi:hypothetical protein